MERSSLARLMVSGRDEMPQSRKLPFGTKRLLGIVSPWHSSLRIDLAKPMTSSQGTGPEGHFLKSGYQIREDPLYFTDSPNGNRRVWQPDLYKEVGRVARTLRSTRIIDVGCGSAEKLVPFHPGHEIVGLDYGPNIESCRSRYNFGQWVTVDLDTAERLPVSDGYLSESVLVCSDVIEHVRRPDNLLRCLRAALNHADALLISTPERTLTWGQENVGPPPNPAHVREWSLDEFSQLLKAHTFRVGWVGLTRSHSWSLRKKTIVGILQ
jgi:SAM-dependent methyltransferase